MKKIFLIGFFLISSLLHAQDFGFGCLGLVGGFAGYSIQTYRSEAINDRIDFFNALHKDSLQSPMNNFGQAAGFRFGINFFEQEFSGFSISFKGYYQKLSEKHKAIIKSGSIEIAKTFEVQMSTFAVGADFGTPITDMLKWKIIKASLIFSSADFMESEDRPGELTKKDDYKSKKINIGYSLSTGFVVYLIGNYISLEGSAGYSLFHFNTLEKSGGSVLTVNELSNQPVNTAVNSGGLTGTIQINFNFPL